jgi:hypothetical protein
MPEFLQLMEGWDKFHSVRQNRFSESDIARVVNLVTNKDGLPSYKLDYLMREAVTTSDFPNLFGFVIDREVLARYKVSTADWKSYFRMKTATNFNDIQRHKVTGADDRLPVVAEKGEYLVGGMSEGYYHYSVAKHGRQFDISWESIVNDSMGAFADIPERFANAAIRSEAFQATSTYASATGPNAALFGATITDAADGQAVTNLGVLPLTIANLETTLALMAAQRDVNGEPIGVMGKHLVVPPALEYTARQILTSGIKMWSEGAAGTPAPYPTTNVVSQVGLQLHVDPYLPVVDTGASAGGSWYVFADPSQGAAMEFAYLRGNETPEICMKNSDKVTSAGGALSPFSGDFATDNIFYRVRCVYGSGQMDPRFAYAQQHA